MARRAPRAARPRWRATRPPQSRARPPAATASGWRARATLPARGSADGPRLPPARRRRRGAVCASMIRRSVGVTPHRSSSRRTRRGTPGRLRALREPRGDDRGPAAPNAGLRGRPSAPGRRVRRLHDGGAAGAAGRGRSSRPPDRPGGRNVRPTAQRRRRDRPPRRRSCAHGRRHLDHIAGRDAHRGGAQSPVAHRAGHDRRRTRQAQVRRAARSRSSGGRTRPCGRSRAAAGSPPCWNGRRISPRRRWRR
jgi:hypothetical protein